MTYKVQGDVRSLQRHAKIGIFFAGKTKNELNVLGFEGRNENICTGLTHYEKKGK